MTGSARSGRGGGASGISRPTTIRRTFRKCRGSGRIGMFAVLSVLIMATVAFVPLFGEADSASSSDGYWTYTVTSDGKVTGSGSATAIPTAAGASGTTGIYTSNDGTHVGSWGFDSDGYGPFGSFYAAFDACHGNRIVCHLDPNNLRLSLDGNIEIDDSSEYRDSEGTEHTVNIMWVLPTIYWSVDGSGNLVLSNDPSKGTAYAHTFDGRDEPYEYLGIGVYEASTTGEGEQTKLTSTTNSHPLYSHPRSDFRTYAGRNVVATEDGTTPTGHAMLWNLYAWQLYRFCVLTVGGGWNSEAIFGNGDLYGFHYGSKVNATGDLDGSGPYAGNVGDTGSGGSHHSDSVKAFIEDAWGSLYDFVDGVLIYYNNNQVQVYATQAKVPSDSAGDYADMKIGVLPSSSGCYGPSTSSDYPAFWGLPSSGAAGSTSSGLFDWIWSDMGSSYSSPYGLFVGGDSNGQLQDAPLFGISFMNARMATNASGENLGGRLAFAFDADPAATVVPDVTYNHDDLRALLKESGYSEDLADRLPGKPEGKETYDCLGEVAEFRHAGWIVDGKLYPADYPFVKTEDHEARSVWVRLPAVTYDHTGLIELSQDRSSTVGLSNGLGIGGHERYEQLPIRNGYAHVGWRIVTEGGEEVEVGPTDKFVTRQSHKAASLWTEVPTVVFDHSQLTDLVGEDADGVSDLAANMVIQRGSKYPQLPNTAGYRHVGWEIDGGPVGSTAELVSQETHIAKSIWKKISIPIIPDDTDGIEIIVPDDSGSQLDDDGKAVLLVAIVVAIIAELTVLSISRKR